MESEVQKCDANLNVVKESESKRFCFSSIALKRRRRCWI